MADTRQGGSRVRFEVALTNGLPAALAGLFREKGDEISTRRADREAAAAETTTLHLTRTVWMPSVPRVGDEVEAHPSWDPVTVEEMFWRIDPPDDEGPVAVVVLSDLDEDVVGQGTAMEFLQEAGWAVDDSW